MHLYLVPSMGGKEPKTLPACVSKCCILPGPHFPNPTSVSSFGCKVIYFGSGTKQEHVVGI